MFQLSGKAEGNSVIPDEWNSLAQEVEAIILGPGQTLDGLQFDQLGKGIAAYASVSDRYTDSGVADAYVLTPTSGFEGPPMYYDGMRVRFRPTNASTGAAMTVNVNTLGAKSITLPGGVTPFFGGALSTSRDVTLIFDSGNDRFEIYQGDPRSVDPEPAKDVRAYGATGDGTTDDTTAIQNAIDDASFASGTVIFPPGVYSISGLSVTTDFTRLIFDDFASLALRDNSDAPVIAVSAEGVVVRARDPFRPASSVAHIAGNSANQTAGTSQGISVAADSHAFFCENLTITDCEDRGVYIQDSDRCTCSRLAITLTGRMGIQARATNGDAVDDFRVESCFIDRSDAAANSDGCIEITCDVGGTAIRPIVAHNTVIMHTTPTGSNVVPIELFGDVNVLGSLRDGKVIGNHVTGGSIGISVASGAVNVPVVGNTVFDALNINIEVANSRDCPIDSNTCDLQGGTGQGIVTNNNAGASATTRRNTITGNIVINVGSGQGIYVVNSNSGWCTISSNIVEGSDDDADGIFVLDCEGWVVCVGNTIELSGAGTTQRRGFIFNNSENCKFTGNQVINAHRAGQIVANAMTVSNFIVAHNDWTGCTNQAVQIVEQSGGIVANAHIYQNLPADEMHYLDAQASVNTTSGTAHDFTLRNPQADRITCSFQNVSLSGTDDLLIQIGTGGTPASSGYSSVSGAVNSTVGMIVTAGVATALVTGHMVLTRITGDTWVASHVVVDTNGNTTAVGGGRIVLGGTLDILRLTRTGTDTFDNGQFQVHVE